MQGVNNCPCGPVFQAAAHHSGNHSGQAVIEGGHWPSRYRNGYRRTLRFDNKRRNGVPFINFRKPADWGRVHHVRAFVYTRQSQDKTGEEWGVDRQRSEIMRFIAHRGWTVVDEFADNDVSAYKKKPRPQFNEMMRRVDAGGADVICAKHLDRLLRRLAELEDVITRCEPTGTAIVTTADGVDTSTEGGRLVARILASVAQGEVERKGARQKAAAKQAADQGRWIGGRRPFGYREGAKEADPIESALVRGAYSAILDGESLHSIAKDWNAAGVKTTVGNEWTGATVSQMLLKPRYAGLRTYEGVIVGSGQWEPIVEEPEWKAVEAILKTPGRQVAPTARKHLLSGIMICGKCLKTVGSGFNLHPIYKCKNCGGVSKQIEPIDKLVTKLLIAFMATEEANELLVDRSGEDVGPLIEREKVINRAIDQLAIERAQELLTARQVRVATDNLEAERKEIQTKLRRTARARNLEQLVCDNPEPVWMGWSLDRRRMAIKESVELILYPGRRGVPFKPEHLGHRWLIAED